MPTLWRCRNAAYGDARSSPGSDREIAVTSRCGPSGRAARARGGRRRRPALSRPVSSAAANASRRPKAGAMIEEMAEQVISWTLLPGAHDFPAPDGGTSVIEAAIVAAG